MCVNMQMCECIYIYIYMYKIYICINKYIKGSEVEIIRNLSIYFKSSKPNSRLVRSVPGCSFIYPHKLSSHCFKDWEKATYSKINQVCKIRSVYVTVSSTSHPGKIAVFTATSVVSPPHPWFHRHICGFTHLNLSINDRTGCLQNA